MPDLALPLLHDAVVARFAADSTPCAFTFGWREPAKQGTGGPRIVTVPGDDLGNLGEVGAPRQPGRNPKPLAGLNELFHVVISTANLTTPEDERAQYIACRLLFDAWARAALLHAGSMLRFIGASWQTDRETRRYGAALVVVCTIEATIVDAPLPETDLSGIFDFSHARGLAGVTLLDVTDTVATALAPAPALACAAADVALSGEQTIDTISVVAGNRVLVIGQDNAAENGVYVVALGAWSRTADVLVTGLCVTVASGDESAPAIYRLSTEGTITPDVTETEWTRITPG